MVDKKVILQEVGPRDGLQNERRALSPEVRAKLIEKLVNSGLARIQIGSFVDARRVPQMAGTDMVWQLVGKKTGVRYSALALNKHGLESAIAASVPHVEIYVSASETHSRKNVGKSATEALLEASGMIRHALAHGLSVTAGVMCAFGCFFEGAVPVEKVAEIVAELNMAGQGSRLPEGGRQSRDSRDCAGQVEIGLADTTGMGDPDSVKRVLESLAGLIAMDRIAMHLHDTRGLGIANMKAALEMGVRRFDTSVGGLGGCPFIPGAAGNIATERVVEEVESMGFSTGVNVERIRQVAEDVVALLGRSPAP
ncbi:MAG: hydroxymethylglutaryl-CoA lyase [Desulfomonile tiedjei]|nr:hydroxymethylglutaryl-CoA lyase [Desulfomonile tiedjei]